MNRCPILATFFCRKGGLPRTTYQPKPKAPAWTTSPTAGGMLLSVNLTLAHVGAPTKSKEPFDALTSVYLERCSAFAHCRTEAFRSEEALLEWLGKQQGRTPAVAVLLDSRGRLMSSEAFAGWLGARRDDGAQHIVFAIGPASGWSDTARTQSQLLLSLGPMTLAHALA